MLELERKTERKPETKPLRRRIYIVRVVMSSPERVEEARMIDDNTKEIKYAFPKSVRQKIERVRNRYKNLLYGITVNFYGLQMIDDRKVEEIRRIVSEADRELKEIDASLSARFVLVPVSEEAIERGELYAKILYAIQYQILKEVFQRVKDLKSDTPRKVTKESIRDMLERMRELNILHDESIDRLIDNVSKMLDMKTEEIKRAILEELEWLERELELL